MHCVLKGTSYAPKYIHAFKSLEICFAKYKHFLNSDSVGYLIDQLNERSIVLLSSVSNRVAFCFLNSYSQLTVSWMLDADR